MGRLADMVARGEATATPVPARPSLRDRVASGELFESPAPAQAGDEPQVPGYEAVLGRYASTIPFAKTLGAAAVTPFAHAGGEPARLTDKAKAEMEKLGIPIPEEQGAGATFRFLKKAGESRRELGRKQHPVKDLIGTGLGVATSLALPTARALKGADVAARVVPAVASGGAYGAIGGFENGPGELTKGEFGQVLKDTIGVTGLQNARQSIQEGRYGRALLDFMGAGSIGGWLTGGLGGLAVEAFRRPLSKALEARGIRKGRDVLQGGSDIAAPTRKPLSDEAVKEVLDSGAMGATTQGTYANIEKEAGKLGDAYARIVRDLEAQGVRGPDVRKLADQLFEEYAKRYRNTGADKAGAQALFDEAANLEDIAEGAPNMSLSRMEDVKRSVQNSARFDRLKNSSAEEGRQEAASIIRQANEDAIADAARASGEGSETARLAADFVPTKQRLGRLLEARTAAERGAVKAAAKSSQPGLVDHLIAQSGAGDPATAYMAALAVSKARSLLPAALSRSLYGAGRGLESGASQTGLAKLLALTGSEANSSLTPEAEARLRAMEDVLRSR